MPDTPSYKVGDFVLCRSGTILWRTLDSYDSFMSYYSGDDTSSTVFSDSEFVLVLGKVRRPRGRYVVFVLTSKGVGCVTDNNLSVNHF